MAKRKGKLSGVGIIKKLANKVRKNPEKKSFIMSNPAVASLVETLGPAAASYILSRISGRVMQRILQRWPRVAKHAAPGSSLLMFFILWGVSEKVGKLKKYQPGLMVGAGLAVIDTIIRTYTPGLAAALYGDQMVIRVAAAPEPKQLTESTEMEDFDPGNSTLGALSSDNDLVALEAPDDSDVDGVDYDAPEYTGSLGG